METELASTEPRVQVSQEGDSDSEGEGEDGEEGGDGGDESSETREEYQQENIAQTQTVTERSTSKGEEEEEEDEPKSLFSNRIEELDRLETGEGSVDQVDWAVPSVSITDTAEEAPVLKPVSARWCHSLLFSALLSAWLCLMLYCYLSLSTACTEVTLWCPEPTTSFTTRACCSSLWLSLGAPVGLGNECNIDMADMESKCAMYDCYKNKTDGTLNVNGCSYVPNTLFNLAACNIHDLWKAVNLIINYLSRQFLPKKCFLLTCFSLYQIGASPSYITPGASKKDCDDTFVENIVRVYCDNVNVVERLSCIGRAQVAGAVVSAIDSFYDESEEIRSGCSQTVSYGSTLVTAVILTIVVAGTVHIILKTTTRPDNQPRDTEPLRARDGLLEEKIEEITGPVLAADIIETEDTSLPDTENEDSNIKEVNEEVKDEDLTKLLYEDDEDFVVKSSELVLTEDPGRDSSELLEQSTMEGTEHNDNQL